MSIVPDKNIKKLIKNGEINILPYFDLHQGPNCYYCHIGENFLVPKKIKKEINPLSTDSTHLFRRVKTPDSYILNPGKFVLAESFEKFGVSNKYIIRLYNSSSLARSGIGHLALGMINSGCGVEKPIRITLELFNASPFQIKLVPSTIKKDRVKFGTEVFKISVDRMTTSSSISYSKWEQGIFGSDETVIGSKMHKRNAIKKQVLNFRNSLQNE